VGHPWTSSSWCIGCFDYCKPDRQWSTSRLRTEWWAFFSSKSFSNVQVLGSLSIQKGEIFWSGPTIGLQLGLDNVRDRPLRNLQVLSHPSHGPDGVPPDSALNCVYQLAWDYSRLSSGSWLLSHLSSFPQILFYPENRPARCPQLRHDVRNWLFRMEQGNNLLSFGLHVEGKFLKQRKLKKRVNKTDRQLTKEKKIGIFFSSPKP